MPGPVSDGYDPEFGTTSNAGEVSAGIENVRNEISTFLGERLENILEVVRSKPGAGIPVNKFSEREWRIIRFAMNRALETL